LTGSIEADPQTVIAAAFDQAQARDLTTPDAG
jgi:hypothetical protein